MGYRWEHPTGFIACKLHEHGCDRESQDAELYDKLEAELIAAVRLIAAKPEYAGIIDYTSFPDPT